MPRRRREASGGLELPLHLLPDAVSLDPDGWKRGRLEWARGRAWGRGKLGFLAFFDETVVLHHEALRRVPPKGCFGRHSNRTTRQTQNPRD